MAPITDTVVDELKNLVKRLEGRVLELENKLTGGSSSSSSESAESMRMVIMGPPGAGRSLNSQLGISH